MIHIVTSENRRLYDPHLEVLRGPDGEIDDAGAIHFLAFDDDMRLEIGLSLRPTDPRRRLAEAVPHIVAPGEAPKKGPDVWEATRLFTAQAHGARTGPDRGARMVETWAAAMELALVNGVERLVGMIDTRLHPWIASAPLGARLAGLPRAHGDGVIAGLEIAVTRALLDRAYEAIGVEGPVGYHVDALDLRAFGDLAAETLYRLNDTSRGPRDRADRVARPPTDRLNA